jgi:non-canonical poly(A) RNA polymerase PAPD5/7
MDPSTAWFQEEQEGQAKRIWLNIWDTVSEMETNANDKGNNTLDHKSSSENNLSNTNNSNNNNNNNNSTTVSAPEGGTPKATLTTSNSSSNFIVDKTFNPTRRKTGSTIDNKASTFNMNKYQTKLIGKHGGCPWRPPNFHYSRGIMG